MSFDVANQLTKLVDQYWRDDIQETDEFSDAFWQRCQSMPTATVNTKGEKWKVRSLYNESEAGFDFDGQALATGSNSQFQNLYVPVRTMSTTGLITQRAIDEDDGKSKYHPVVEEMNSTKLAAVKKLQRHILLDDGTGRIAVVSDNYATPAQLTAAPNTTFGNKGVQFLKQGKLVQVYDATGATQRVGGGADKITVSTATAPVKSTGVTVFTGTVPTDTVATDIIVPEGMAGRGVNGIEYWVANSGSLFELSRSTYPGLQSTMVDGSSGSLLVLVETMFAKMAHYIEEDTALKGGHEIFWSPTQRQKYRQEALGLGITMAGASNIDAGYGHKEEINGYTATCIKDHSNTKIHFLIMNSWYRIGNPAAVPFTPYNEPGSGANLYNVRSTSSGGLTTALAFTLRAYANLACKNVRAQSALYSLPTTGLQTGN
jgi:hypothetical protein